MTLLTDRIFLLAHRISFAVAAMFLLSTCGQDSALAQNSEEKGTKEASSSKPISDPPGDRTVTFRTAGASLETANSAGSNISDTKSPLTEARAEAKEKESKSIGNTLVLKGGTTDSSSYEDALAIEAPQPELPAEHNEQGIKTSCCARFTIEEDGTFSVRLVSSTGSQEVDDLALATLRRWKFKPAQLNGKAVKSSRKIKIEFEIE